MTGPQRPWTSGRSPSALPQLGGQSIVARADAVLAREVASWRAGQGTPRSGPTPAPGWQPSQDVSVTCAQPGQPVRWRLVIRNPGTEPWPLHLFVTDLLSERGGVIPRHEITFQPARCVLPAGGEATIEMHAQLPLQTLPGSYAGLVRASGLAAYSAVITCDVP